MAAPVKIRLLALAIALLCAAGCKSAPPRSDAELGLTPVQVSGRQLFIQHCGECHEAYSSGGRNGPSLQGMFKKPYMPSGTPANDDRVREVITIGRSKMPGFGRVLDPQQVDELIAYLHTL